MSRLAYVGSLVVLFIVAGLAMANADTELQVSGYVGLTTLAMIGLGIARAADIFDSRVGAGLKWALSIVVGLISPIVLVALILCFVPSGAKASS